MSNRRSTLKSFIGLLSLPFAAKAIAHPDILIGSIDRKTPIWRKEPYIYQHTYLEDDQGYLMAIALEDIYSGDPIQIDKFHWVQAKPVKGQQVSQKFYRAIKRARIDLGQDNA